MKIQCACGAKVAFDVTPEMAQTRVQFVCPNCGQDSSDLVNELIQREFSAASEAAPPPVEIAHPPSADGTTPPLPPRVTVSVRPTAVPAPSPAAEKPAPLTVTVRPAGGSQTGVRVGDVARAAATSKFCSKHPGVRTTHECLVCHKPICAKCMQLFGYVCSPRCKEKAELQGIEIPVYAGQRDVVARGQWRRVALLGTGITVAVAAFLGAWVWYAWFAAVPYPIFSLPFDHSAYSGSCELMPDNQLVFLHGLTLARYDIRTKKEIWSNQIVGGEEITNVVNETLQELSAEHDKQLDQQGDVDWRVPNYQDVLTAVTEGEEGGLSLQIAEKNIWVSSFGKLTRYDYDTGKPVQTVDGGGGRLQARGNHVFIVNADFAQGTETVKNVDLATGQTEDQQVPIDQNLGAQTSNGPRHPRSGALDPDEIAARYSHMTMSEKTALPATLSIAKEQQDALDEMHADNGAKPEQPQAKKAITIPADSYRTVPTKQGVIQFSERLLEENITTREAMQAAPTKSALDGNLTVANTGDAANEILNEMRRNSGGATVEENDSRYQVTLRSLGSDGTPDWHGEVIGPPRVFPLETVNVVAGNNTITVLDQNNKELWKSDLAYNLNGGFGFLPDQMGEAEDQGACVERDNTLYVHDQGVLTAFDLATGNARWRVPTVGIYALHFNDDGMLYVSTTTASPDTIKYSNQIDLSDRTADVLMKIDPKNGAILWQTQPGGKVVYVSGKYVYTLAAYQPPEDDQHPFEAATGFETPPFMRLKRINPENGKQMWEYFQQRCPLDAQFDKNLIELVFRKEVVVLKYLTL